MDRKEKRRIRLALGRQQTEIEETHCATCERFILAEDGTPTNKHDCKECPHFAALTAIGEKLNNLTNYRKEAVKSVEIPMLEKVEQVEAVFSVEEYHELHKTLSNKQIRKQFNITIKAFNNWRYKYNIAKDVRYTKKEKEQFAKEQTQMPKIEEVLTVAEFMELRKTKSVKVIADLKCVGYSTLMKWLKDNGLTKQYSQKEQVVPKVEKATHVANVVAPTPTDTQNYETEIAELVAKLNATQVQIAEMQHDHIVEVQGLQEHIKASEQLVTQLEADYKEAAEKIISLETTVRLASEERDSYKIIANEALNRVGQLEDEQEPLRKENKELSTYIDQLEDQIKAFKKWEAFIVGRLSVELNQKVEMKQVAF